MEFARRLQRGTSPMLAANGTRSLPPNHGLTVSLFPSLASVADGNSQLTSLHVGSSALVPALNVTAIRKRNEQLPVYNLSVEGCPMFYANGILTHNCDALGLIGQLIDRMFSGKAVPGPDTSPQPRQGQIKPPPVQQRKPTQIKL